ncbi:hypothetical protein HMPREF1983_01087 [Gemella bergeri ATCC 700627]|uniref:Uncharacterized protein n=1 Tax=Gemella bergeri ATCC 700627 TaxID=1321820 RepID=U2RVF4_9BACL|nr:hypothetical protein HMPREF1983_01087 [Gemella bergeri ATCC 700627]
MSQDKIIIMASGKCIFQLQSIRSFLSDKFDITKHKNYKLLEDYDKKNVFLIGKAKFNRNTVIYKNVIFSVMALYSVGISGIMK